MEHNLRGYGFEYISKILLRRQQKNNFIFQMCLFDSVDEILKKYRMSFNESLSDKIGFLKNNWNRCDLVEFELTSKREIIEIRLYEVKTKHMNAKKPYFEMCQSNYIAMNQATKELNIPVFFASIIMFENWRFSLNCIPYKNGKIRTFTHYKEKIDEKTQDELLQELLNGT